MNAFSMSDERNRTFLKWCSRLRPQLLRGYVSALLDYARFLEENHLRFPPLKGIILGAERVDEEDQRTLERVFGAPAFNTYGGREMALMAMECDHKCGLHEVSENNYLEFEPVGLADYENAGNIIVTGLHNFAMPFIRYRIEDIGVPGESGTCACGRGLPRIARVLGRTVEVFTFHDGTRMSGILFLHIMRDFPIDEYQFIQTSDRRILLRARLEGGVPDEMRDTILRAYTRLLPDGVTLDFEEVDAFERTASGKFRFIYADHTKQEQDVNA
jgi:phenylacetate-CoA ligase